MKLAVPFVAFLAFLSILCAAARPLEACTFVTMAKNGVVLVGYNEDFNDLRTKIWFFQAEEKAYGRMIWGYDRALFPYQGGLNDQGLFVDFNAVDRHTGWRADPRKPNLEEEFDGTEYILEHIATVDEAVALFQKYNIALDHGSYVLADARGSSAIIEWAKDELRIVRKNGDYQIATNFIQSSFSGPAEFTDDRYRIAERIFRTAAEPSVDLIRRVLSTVHYEAIGNATLYSTICDLVHKRVLVYHFHNYEAAAVFDLDRELKRGNTSRSIPGLFPVRPFSEILFRNGFRQLGAEALMKVIDEKGTKDLAKELADLKSRRRTFDRYVFADWVIQSVGLHYLSLDKVEEAIEVFKLNVQEYPDSWAAYADLAEAYRKKGDIPLAVQYYRKALENNPENKKIAGILSQLKNRG